MIFKKAKRQIGTHIILKKKKKNRLVLIKPNQRFPNFFEVEGPAFISQSSSADLLDHLVSSENIFNIFLSYFNTNIAL